MSRAYYDDPEDYEDRYNEGPRDFGDEDECSGGRCHRCSETGVLIRCRRHDTECSCVSCKHGWSEVEDMEKEDL